MDAMEQESKVYQYLLKNECGKALHPMEMTNKKFKMMTNRLTPSALRHMCMRHWRSMLQSYSTYVCNTGP